MKRGDFWQRKPGGPFYARQWDPAKRRWMERSTGCTNERVARELAVRWVQEGELMQSGLAPPGAADARKPLPRQADDFIDVKRHHQKRLRPTHIANTRRCIDRVVEATGWTSIAQISLDGVVKAISGIRKDDGSLPANATLNHYRSAWKAFTAWLHKNGRLQFDPLAGMERWTKDPVRTRRALTDDELRRLLEATASGGERFGMSATDRTMLYLFAVSTGFRKGEIASLDVGSFVLGARPPHVRLSVLAAKNRKAVEQPLPALVAQELDRWLAGRDRLEKAWRTMTDSTASMLRADALAAGIPPIDGFGRRVDFHALRHTFITRLARAGVSPQAAQKLARHSDVNLTMGFYTHLASGELATELDKGIDMDLSQKCRGEMSASGRAAAGNADQEPLHGGGDSSDPGSDEDRKQRADGELGEWAGPDSNRGLVDYESSEIDSESTDGPMVARVARDECRESVTARGGSARERAEAGLEPDVDLAFERIGGIVALARKGRGR